MTWGSFWNGFKNVVSAPYKLVASVGKKLWHGVKTVANVGVNAVKSVANFAKDSFNTVLHMPEKVLHTVDHGIDKGSETFQSLFKSPMMLLLGVGSIILLPSLMK